MESRGSKVRSEGDQREIRGRTEGEDSEIRGSRSRVGGGVK